MSLRARCRRQTRHCDMMRPPTNDRVRPQSRAAGIADAAGAPRDLARRNDWFGSARRSILLVPPCRGEEFGEGAPRRWLEHGRVLGVRSQRLQDAVQRHVLPSAVGRAVGRGTAKSLRRPSYRSSPARRPRTKSTKSARVLTVRRDSVRSMERCPLPNARWAAIAVRERCESYRNAPAAVRAFGTRHTEVRGLRAQQLPAPRARVGVGCEGGLPPVRSATPPGRDARIPCLSEKTGARVARVKRLAARHCLRRLRSDRQQPGRSGRRSSRAPRLRAHEARGIHRRVPGQAAH